MYIYIYAHTYAHSTVTFSFSFCSAFLLFARLLMLSPCSHRTSIPASFFLRSLAKDAKESNEPENNLGENNLGEVALVADPWHLEECCGYLFFPCRQ